MMFPPQISRHGLMLGGSITGGVVATSLCVWAIVAHRRPTAEQREEKRRRHLAATGRIVDGSLLEAAPSEQEPQSVFYRYRIAGVTYDCSQDVSTLRPLVENLRLDFPVQVRYDRNNPADSIIVAETWNGLWTNIWHGSRAQNG